MPYTSEGIFYADTSTDVSVVDNSIELANSVSSVLSGSAFYSDIIYYRFSSLFQKANYPGLKAIRVMCLGGGGGGAGCQATTTAQVAVGHGGQGGWYAESFIKDIDSLPASVNITIGAGGAGGLVNGLGSPGGNTSFGSLVIAKGGAGSGKVAAGAIFYTSDITNFSSVGNVGQLVLKGDEPSGAIIVNNAQGQYSLGGGNFLFKNPLSNSSGSGNGIPLSSTFHSLDAMHGIGGSGGYNAQSQTTARTGAAGRPGIVMIEVYQ
jgi:hypothetical protein